MPCPRHFSDCFASSCDDSDDSRQQFGEPFFSFPQRFSDQPWRQSAHLHQYQTLPGLPRQQQPELHQAAPSCMHDDSPSRPHQPPSASPTTSHDRATHRHSNSNKPSQPHPPPHPPPPHQTPHPRHHPRPNNPRTSPNSPTTNSPSPATPAAPARATACPSRATITARS